MKEEKAPEVLEIVSKALTEGHRLSWKAVNGAVNLHKQKLARKLGGRWW